MYKKKSPNDTIAIILIEQVSCFFFCYCCVCVLFFVFNEHEEICQETIIQLIFFFLQDVIL